MGRTGLARTHVEPGRFVETREWTLTTGHADGLQPPASHQPRAKRSQGEATTSLRVEGGAARTREVAPFPARRLARCGAPLFSPADPPARCPPCRPPSTPGAPLSQIRPSGSSLGLHPPLPQAMARFLKGCCLRGMNSWFSHFRNLRA